MHVSRLCTVREAVRMSRLTSSSGTLLGVRPLLSFYLSATVVAHFHVTVFLSLLFCKLLFAAVGYHPIGTIPSAR